MATIWIHIAGERYDKKKQLAKNIVNAALSGYGAVCMVAECDFCMIRHEIFDFLSKLKVKFIHDKTSRILRVFDSKHTEIRFYRIDGLSTDILRMRLQGFDYGTFSISLRSDFSLSRFDLNELKRILSAHGRGTRTLGYITYT